MQWWKYANCRLATTPILFHGRNSGCFTSESVASDPGPIRFGTLLPAKELDAANGFVFRSRLIRLRKFDSQSISIPFALVDCDRDFVTSFGKVDFR